MSSLAGRSRGEFVCTHCAGRTDWAWVIKYQSYLFTQYVYLCSNCGRVMKIDEKKAECKPARRTAMLSSPSDAGQSPFERRSG